MRKNQFLRNASLLLPTGAALLAGCSDTVDNPPVPDPEPISPAQRYNIVFITCDQEAYMEQYPAGSDYAARNYLRSIGTTFEKHYACANVSTSSRSVIYTGRHITETFMLDNTNYAFVNNMSRHIPTIIDLSYDVPTVGKMLRMAGYYTAFKGKWHISKDTESLEKYGFADWTEGDMYGSVYEGWKEDETILNNSVEWLKNKGLDMNKEGQPFFLAVNFLNPHDVMYFNEDGIGGIAGEGVPAPNDPIYEKSYPQNNLPATWDDALDSPGRPQAHTEYYYNWERMVGPTPKTPDQWRKFRDYYFNTIQNQDNYMMKLLNYMNEAGLMKNTIIIYTSDHGELQGEHGMKGKGGNIYENNIHVPLIVYHPEVEGGRHCTNLTSHLDLAPTFLDYATNGNKIQFNAICGELHGHSLAPVVKNPDTDVRNGEGALFCFEMLSMIDSAFVLNPQLSPAYRADLNKRGFVRGIITPEYKMARYFSPLNFNTPADVEELYANNDVEIYTYGSDERDNLAWPKGNNSNIVDMMNKKLNALIEREIGIDNGREVHIGGGYAGGIKQYDRNRTKE